MTFSPRDLSCRVVHPATLLCKECCDESHHADIEKYYNSILNCLKTAACNNVPTSKIGFHKYWWTPELDDLKKKCIPRCH